MKNGNENGMSPAMTLIQHVAAHQGHRRGRSRHQLKQGVKAAVRLAIEYGLEWNKGDFSELGRQRTEGYHDSSIYQADEGDYATACGSHRGSANPTAAMSYEAWRNRKPFLIRDKGNKTPTRVYVGRRIEWRGDVLEVTSFNDEEGYFIAVQHDQAMRRSNVNEPPVVGEHTYYMGGYRRIEAVSDDGLTVIFSTDIVDKPHASKVLRRVKINHKDIQEQRQANELAGQLEVRFGEASAPERAAFEVWFREKHGHGRPQQLGLAQLREALDHFAIQVP